MLIGLVLGTTAVTVSVPKTPRPRENVDEVPNGVEILTVTFLRPLLGAVALNVNEYVPPPSLLNGTAVLKFPVPAVSATAVNCEEPLKQPDCGLTNLTTTASPGLAEKNCPLTKDAAF